MYNVFEFSGYEMLSTFSRRSALLYSCRQYLLAEHFALTLAHSLILMTGFCTQITLGICLVKASKSLGGDTHPNTNLTPCLIFESLGRKLSTRQVP